VAYLSQAFSQSTGTGRFWISLGAIGLPYEFGCIRKQGMIRFLVMPVDKPEKRRHMRPEGHKPGRQEDVACNSPDANPKLFAEALRFEERLKEKELRRGSTLIAIRSHQEAPLILMVEK
jgi:hypothetical protein